MKISELEEYLCSRSGDFDKDAEILVEQDGMLYDFGLEKTEEVFDGFDTFYPEGLKIVIKEDTL